jgi:hypothetical protein
MQSQLTQFVAREQAVDRLERAQARRQAARTGHPPSRVRWRAASVVARVAARLDADAARLAVR